MVTIKIDTHPQFKRSRQPPTYPPPTEIHPWIVLLFERFERPEYEGWIRADQFRCYPSQIRRGKYFLGRYQSARNAVEAFLRRFGFVHTWAFYWNDFIRFLVDWGDLQVITTDDDHVQIFSCLMTEEEAEDLNSRHLPKWAEPLFAD